MGFVLSVLYFVTYYLTPVTIFGQLAAFRIELILAVIVALISLPKLVESFALKTPQSLAVIGLGLAALLSVTIGMSWAGGGVQALFSFIPNALAYFLVCLHCDSKKKLQVLVLMMLFVCLFVIAQGSIELQRGLPASTALQAGDIDAQAEEVDNSPYLFVMMNDTGDLFYRLKGRGEINDPNDFGQLIVCVLPLVFIFWTPKKTFTNIAFVLLPVCVLLFGVYLTHSRGAMLALLATVIVASRRRVGTMPSLLIAVVLFIAASASGFTGGRDISAAAGEDRTTLWGEGLRVLKAHPLFGVGFGKMADYTDSGHTAHNSVVVCAAELGLFGMYFWALFLFSTMRDTLVIASPGKVAEAQPTALEERRFPQLLRSIEAVNKQEICSMGRLVLLSLTGFLVAGWFLSRAYVMTLFLLGGFVEVIFEMALRQGMISPRLPLARVLRYAGGLAISLLVLMYVMLRIINLTH